MSGEVIVTVIGSTTGAAELRFVPSGAAVCNWTIAVNPRRFDKQSNEWQEQPAQFYRCAVWRDQAEHVAETLTRPGIRVMVTGKLNPREYEKDNVKRMSLEIDVEEVGVALRFAPVAVPEKAARQGNGGQGNGGGDGSQERPGTGGGGSQQPAGDPWATSGEAPF